MPKNVSKADWIDMFSAIGLDEAQMDQWHGLFERRHPEGHESFLAWLGLTPDEIARIRAHSR